jgi:hypothetical protein
MAKIIVTFNGLVQQEYGITKSGSRLGGVREMILLLIT